MQGRAQTPRSRAKSSVSERKQSGNIRNAGMEPPMSKLLTRRTLITAGLTTVAGAAGVQFAGRYGLMPPDYRGILGIGETLTYSAQRLLTSGHSLAREFKRSDISKTAVVNGPAPKDDRYRRLLAGGFKDWRLTVDGMVARPL